MELPLDDLLKAFQTQQREQLLVAVDKLVTGAVRDQREMLLQMEKQAQKRHCEALNRLRDEILSQQPTALDAVLKATLEQPDSGLFSWINDETKKQQGQEIVGRLRDHLKEGHGNAFRSDFEALLALYMEVLHIPMQRGSRLVNRVEDFREALMDKAGANEENVNLVYRVRWGCNGVRTIGNARSHDSTPLTESEALELCSCLSGIGNAMPTLALQFEACQKKQSNVSDLSSDDLMKLIRQAAVSTNDQATLEMLLRLMANQSDANVLTGMLNSQPNEDSTPTTPTMKGWSSSSRPVSLSPLRLHGSIGQKVSPKQSLSSSANGVWGRPSPPSASASPQKPSSAPSSPPPTTPKTPSSKPSEAMLKLVPTFKFYYERPVDLPEERDTGRKIMFARMMNHINSLPKASLCPLQQGHDVSCPLSHSIMEVMAYNPLYKRMICRQADHYWTNQIKEDGHCACLHVNTGLEWKWMVEDKRLFCPQGARCINKKCVKSHSFEEMCWYNPWYKINKCEKRVHDHIVRAHGAIAPPLECIFYHVENGSNADKRDFTSEADYIGKNVKMLFADRSHKPLADALEALQYARITNL